MRNVIRERTEYVLKKNGHVLISSDKLDIVKGIQFLRGGEISKKKVISRISSIYHILPVNLI